ncbi:MAG: efflux RND transporter periplasmic adaptor subunit [Candidatus Lokiarchaeota archaeon]|nr:efflux RND transporter periplasmic adaptor subunit [Candidatus Lokiarchaeota archaeon]
MKINYWHTSLLILLILIILLFVAMKLSESTPMYADDVAIVNYAKLCRTISILGQVESTKKEILTSDLSGSVEKLCVFNGQYINKENAILKMDVASQQEKYLLAKQKLLETQLEIKLAREELERYKRLSKLNQISEQKLSETLLRIEDLEEMHTINKKLLVMQKNRIDKSISKAPFSGVILFDVPIENGYYLHEGQKLGTLICPDSMIVKAKVNQDDALRVKVGQETLIIGYTENNVKTTIKGEVNFVEQIIQNGWTYLKIKPREKVLFKPGITVRVELSFNSEQRKLIVPIESIRISNDKTYVLKIEKDKIEKHDVIIGDNDYQFVEINKANGLKEGDKIIISNFENYENKLN